MNMELWKKYFQYFAENPYLTLGVAGIGLFLVLILLLKIVNRKPRVIKAFSDSSGSVLVSIHAITDLIRATCQHIEGVSRPRIKVRVKRGVTSLELRLRMESGSRIREIRNAIRAHLKKTLETNLGFDHLGKITVVIDEYKAGPYDAVVVSEHIGKTDETEESSSSDEPAWNKESGTAEPAKTAFSEEENENKANEEGGSEGISPDDSEGEEKKGS